MINLEISGKHFELDDKIKQHVKKKIGKLDKYVSKSARKAIHAEVTLTENDGKPTNRYSCEVTLKLPYETLRAEEATNNFFAAVDKTKDKLQSQLLKYKTKHGGEARFARGRRALIRLRKFGR
jgi:putative sigma-54 modulation protein